MNGDFGEFGDVLVGTLFLMEILQVSRPTALRLIRRGDIPAIRVGGHFRIPLSGVENYLIGRGLDPGTVRQIMGSGGHAPTFNPAAGPNATPVEEV